MVFHKEAIQSRLCLFKLIEGMIGCVWCVRRGRVYRIAEPTEELVANRLKSLPATSFVSLHLIGLPSDQPVAFIFHLRFLTSIEELDKLEAFPVRSSKIDM